MRTTIIILLSFAAIINIILLFFRPRENKRQKIEFAVKIFTAACLIATLVLLITK